jgi:hypothetical protein
MKLGKIIKNALKEEFISDKKFGQISPGKALKMN